MRTRRRAVAGLSADRPERLASRSPVRFAEEVEQLGERPVRAVLRDPMAAIGYDAAAHVAGNSALGFDSGHPPTPAQRTTLAKHGHLERTGGAESFVVNHVQRRCPVKIEAGPHRPRQAVGPEVFPLGVFRDRVWPAAPVAVEEAEIEILAPGGQRLGQIEFPVQAVVLAVGEHRRRAVARHRRVERHQPTHRVAMLRRQCEGSRPTPVVADDEISLMPQNVMDKTPDIVRQRLLVVAADGAREITQPAQVRCNHLVALCQAGDDVAPHVPGLRLAMYTHHRQSCARGDVVQRNLAEIRITVPEPFRHAPAPSFPFAHHVITIAFPGSGRRLRIHCWLGNPVGLRILRQQGLSFKGSARWVMARTFRCVGRLPRTLGVGK